MIQTKNDKDVSKKRRERDVIIIEFEPSPWL